jgi:HD-GYP domain-containing protein (c-di-GMP phosphodiesterase class II)
MLKMNNAALTPGMVLARDVFDLKSGLLIVNAGVTLTSELIAKLQQFPRAEIYVEPLNAALQEEHEKLLAAKINVAYQRNVERAKNILTNTEDGAPDPALINLMVGDLKDQIELSSNVILNLSHIKVYAHYLYLHVVNVAALALIIGKQLRLNPSDLHDLGMAALLHDYGMVKLDHAVYDHDRPLNEAEWEQVKRHPEYGMEMLQEMDSISPAILRGILEHHERLDGSGYPRQKRGAELGLFGKIIAIADVYDACISRRKYRGPLTPHATLKILLKGSDLFDLNILKAFIAAMAIYPIGTYVRLNTGEIGKVVGCNPDEPFRPDLKLFLDRDGQKIIPPYRIKLNEQEQREHYIAGSLEGEELQAVLELVGD